jgi:excisionase family DNA binding protein
MDQPKPKLSTPASTPAFTLTVEQLRELIRIEVQLAVGTAKGPGLNPEAGGSQKPYLTVREAAELARLAPSTVRLYIRKRQLKAQKVGRRVIVARTELEAFLSRNPIEVRLQ